MLHPLAQALLRLMEDRGIRWGVVTNKPAWLTGPLMEDLALAQRAAVSISGDQVPSGRANGMRPCSTYRPSPVPSAPRPMP